MGGVAHQPQPGMGVNAPMGGMGGGMPNPAAPGAMGAPAPGYGGYGAPSPAVGGPPQKSTAPTASAMPVTDNMPVAWPLPTKSMQKLGTNQAVAGANMAIQDNSQGGATTIGEPMAPHDLTHVRNVFTMLLDATQDVRKREDCSKRLEELYAKLGSGGVKTACSQKVLQLAKAVEAQDMATAAKLQQELYSVDWEANKNWLMGVKRLITR